MPFNSLDIKGLSEQRNINQSEIRKAFQEKRISEERYFSCIASENKHFNRIVKAVYNYNTSKEF